MNNTIVIIPARGGSKRIKNKNITYICERPMIEWPILELKKEFSNKQIFVSTDSEEIADVCKKNGVRVPFLRPKELSDDYTGTMAVAAHAVKWLIEDGHEFENVLIVYPTAVLLNIKDVKDAFYQLETDNDCDCVMSATAFPFPIQRAVYTDKNGFVQMFYTEHALTRSQDLTSAYHDAGQFYCCRKDAVLRETNWTNGKHKVQLLHRLKVADIDDYEDLEVAEQRLTNLLLKRRNE